jgi:hypothetical protein
MVLHPSQMVLHPSQMVLQPVVGVHHSSAGHTQEQEQQQHRDSGGEAQIVTCFFNILVPRAPTLPAIALFLPAHFTHHAVAHWWPRQAVESLQKHGFKHHMCHSSNPLLYLQSSTTDAPSPRVG